MHSILLVFSTSHIIIIVYTYIYMYVRIHAWLSVADSQHEVKTITVCQAFIIIQTREEARLRRSSERRAAESSEQRETRLARRRVADRARFAAISR